jgi:hypothetical protein
VHQGKNAARPQEKLSLGPDDLELPIALKRDRDALAKIQTIRIAGNVVDRLSLEQMKQSFADD